MVEKKKLTIALAGNANVGKSVIFNQLTKLHQHVGNWPGKTIEKAEGTLHFKGYTIDIIDLPGIYSLSTYSLEEQVSREYIAIENPDIVINVVDASVLERNLFFTLQLLELETPMIIALNQIDLTESKGIKIDYEKLQEILGIPVVPTIAIKGFGIYELLEKAISAIEAGEAKSTKITYSRRIEEGINEIEALLHRTKIKYPHRWVAIKLLEGDKDITDSIANVDSTIVSRVKEIAGDIERIYDEPCPMIIASERYDIVNKISIECQKIVSPEKPRLIERWDEITTHKVFGYLIMVATLFSMFFAVFTFGDFLSSLIEGFFDTLFKGITIEFGTAEAILWEGAVGGFVAGITLVLPYVFPFYFLLSILEDSGYLPRIAFLLDNVMHRMGLHGKALIPLILGYGCNVPACFSCRIMETQRERLIAAFVITLVPCTARTIVILGLVGAFVGIKWAFMLYAIDLFIIFALGRVAFKALPGEATGMIMEIPSYRMPLMRNVLKETWLRTKSIIYMVFPYYIVGGVALGALQIAGFLEPIGEILSPITVGWLGLPAISSILLIFGVVRKELVIVMPAIIFGTANLAAIFTPIQMIVIALVTILYIPCISTIVALKREFGLNKTLYISAFEVGFAIVLGGIALRLLMFLW